MSLEFDNRCHNSDPDEAAVLGDGDTAANSDYPASGRKKALSRRSFLRTAGAGAGAMALSAPPVSATSASQTDANAKTAEWWPWERPRLDRPHKFGRIFHDLPPFAEPSAELREALVELGKPGGLLDANDPLEVGPIRLITEPELSPNNRDNPTHTAGTTFIGQFLDHDITRDGGSRLGRPLHLWRSTNLRTPKFDLDSVYGGNPRLSPELYTFNPIRFRVESGGLFEDLPRDESGNAIIADPRNDENLMLSGLQAAFLLFHNAVSERVESRRMRGLAAFYETRRQVRWHWQWIIVNEFLPQIVGQPMVNDVWRNGRRFFNPRRGQIPVEFQGAAYRFGHSMVRPSYRANLAGDNGDPFFAMVFDPNESEGLDPDSLLGGFRAPRRFIGWQTFFDFGDGEVKPNKTIDTKISTPLFNLPTFTVDSPSGSRVGPLSLATRNLLRHLTWQIPSGQAIARTMGVEPLSSADLADLDGLGASLAKSTPLWFYVLREAEVMAGGLHLGPVGGRLVSEVFHGLLALDRTSIASRRRWRPTLPSRAGAGEFGMVDLLTMAEVDPVSRGQ